MPNKIIAEQKIVKASQISKFLNKTLLGRDLSIKKVVPICDLEKNSFSFLREKYLDIRTLGKVKQIQPALIICPAKFKKFFKCSLIVSGAAYFDFSQTIKKFFNCPRPKIKIGKNFNKKQYVVIGGAGFSYQRNPKGINERIANIGGVQIGDNVDIGSFSTIDRGVLTDTMIGSDVKIDNLVHIAHNCLIGQGTIIAAGASFGGGVIVGKNCFIGLNACIRQRIKIGDGAVVGMGAVVVKDVPPDVVVAGNPARILKKNKN